MIEVVNFAVEHGRKLAPQIPDAMLFMYATQGQGYTALENGEPIASSGLVLSGNGLGHAWGFITDRAKAMPFMLHRQVSRRLCEVIDRNKLRRVDYVADLYRPTAIAWAKRLGFHYEGKMEAFYDDGHPALLYAWIHPDYRRSGD